jgi:NAD(P)-dependent dehydrogenase (short-subunit alcohol dehydrogenase family)
VVSVWRRQSALLPKARTCISRSPRQESLDDAVKVIGSNVTAVQGDVSKLDDLDRLFAQIKQEKGRLDVVFANAGGGEFVPLGSYTEVHFDKTFAST